MHFRRWMFAVACWSWQPAARVKRYSSLSEHASSAKAPSSGLRLSTSTQALLWCGLASLGPLFECLSFAIWSNCLIAKYSSHAFHSNLQCPFWAGVPCCFDDDFDYLSFETALLGWPLIGSMRSASGQIIELFLKMGISESARPARVVENSIRCCGG
jgi:hypothetical protein